jgi:uncharacterized protein YggE
MQAIEPQLADARANVTRLVQAFLRLNREMEIAEKSIQASQLTLRPEYEWNPDTRQQRLTAYFVECQLTVNLRDLAKPGVFDGAGDVRRRRHRLRAAI